MYEQYYSEKVQFRETQDFWSESKVKNLREKKSKFSMSFYAYYH